MAGCAEGKPLLREGRENSFELTTFNKGSLDVFLLGRPGCGKSSLCRDIFGQEAEPRSNGEASPDSGMTCGTRKFPVHNYCVTVHDTASLFDGQTGEHVEEIVDRLREVCSVDRNGVVLVCIEMFAGRIVDRSNLAPLAFLHQKCGIGIWQHVIIALTKADQFPKEQWLELRGIKDMVFTFESTFLNSKFEEYMDETKELLRNCFISSSTREECRIGMTAAQFNDLNIPILPTSKLFIPFLGKMRCVRHETWFEELLIKLCSRLQVFEVHSRRLLNIGKIPDVLPDLNGISIIRLQVEILKRLRIPGLLAFNAYSYSVAFNSPRFQPVELPRDNGDK